MADQSTVDQIKGIVDAGIANLTEETKAAIATAKSEIGADVKGQVDGLRGEIDQKLAALPEPEPDRRGFDPEGRRAPAHVRSSALGDRPILFTDFVRYVRDKDRTKYAPLLNLSEKLVKLGHRVAGSEGLGILMPLTTHPDYFDNGSGEADEFIKYIKDAAWHDDEPDETRHILKALGLITKQQAGDDDTLGGSLGRLPLTGDIIPLLQARSALGRAGARAVPLPPEGMRFPRETGEPTFAYYAENGTITASTVSTGVLNMTPKKAAAIIKMPFELLRMVNAAESFFRDTLIRKAALTEDRSGLEGEGGATRPRGIIRYGHSAVSDTPEADKVTLHTAGTVAADGDTFTTEDVTEMLAAIEEANDPDGATAWILRPLMWAAIYNRRADAVTAADGKGPFMFPVSRGDGRTAAPKELAGVPTVTSTQVNKTSRKGSATDLSYVLAGNFRRMLMGRVGSVELATSEHAGFNEEQLYIRAVIRHDMALEQPSSFVICPTLVVG